MKPNAWFGRLGPAPVELPPTLRRLVGSAATIDRAKLARLATAAGIPAESLTRPVSHARGGQASAPIARYFVVRDTSTPWFGDPKLVNLIMRGMAWLGLRRRNQDIAVGLPGDYERMAYGGGRSFRDRPR